MPIPAGCSTSSPAESQEPRNVARWLALSCSLPFAISPLPWRTSCHHSTEPEREKRRQTVRNTAPSMTHNPRPWLACCSPRVGPEDRPHPILRGEGAPCKHQPTGLKAVEKPPSLFHTGRDLLPARRQTTREKHEQEGEQDELLSKTVWSPGEQEEATSKRQHRQPKPGK